MEKVLSTVRGDDANGAKEERGDGGGRVSQGKRTPSKRETVPLKCLPSLLPWKKELQTEAWRGLEMALFEKGPPGGPLTLPQSPIFVNSPDRFVEMQAVLNDTSVLAIDAEWFDGGSGGANLSTLQVAAVLRQDARIATYILDLLDCRDYHARAAAWIRHFLENPSLLVLGFAAHHDVSRLDEFCRTAADAGPLRPRAVLDLQRLPCPSGKEPRGSGSLPGLAARVSRFSRARLCKDEQRSDWGRRPLTEAQLEYAGIDAAVLLVLLAEHLRVDGGADSLWGVHALTRTPAK
mmetsp:Transcript_34846/g.80569  ORF Transcript_34846/g.80569 Transcript_34846/m.80569 type:complete len:292 (-) Transcript_34846:45-920(-)